MHRPQLVLCHPVRTAIGSCNGRRKDILAPNPGAMAIGETSKRARLDAAKVEALVMGLVIRAGVKTNPARQVGIGGGQGIALAIETM